MTESRKDLLIRLTIITVVIVATFANSLNRGFVWDDYEVIVLNPLIQQLSNIPKFFFLEDIANGPTGYYRPVTYISFALDRAIWGPSPLGFNITNLILHVLVAILFYLVVLELFKRQKLALLAAFFFSLHPLVVETVNFHAGGRNTLLSACFSLASLLCYVRRKRLYSVIFFCLAIFSKEFALLLPFMFFLYDLTSPKERTKPTGYIGFFIAMAAYLALRSVAVMKGNLLDTINIRDNFWIVPQTIISYLKLMLFPFDLKTLYDVENQITWSSFTCYTILVLAILAIAFYLKARRELLFSVAMFLLFLLPVVNLFPLGTAMMADRYAYFSLFGFSLALAYCVSHFRRKQMIAAAVLICSVFAIIDIKRNEIWKNELSLFTQMTKDAPGVFVGYMNLGLTYLARKDYVNAERYLVAAETKKDITPDFLMHIARTLWVLNKPDKALTALNKAIELDPGFYQVYVLASSIYEENGNKSMANTYLEKAATVVSQDTIRKLKENATVYCAKGEEQLARGQKVKAERSFNQALNLDPNFAPALVNMAVIAANKGDIPFSLRYLKKAVSLDPSNRRAAYDLAKICESLGMKSEASEAMKRFDELAARNKPKPAHE